LRCYTKGEAAAWEPLGVLVVCLESGEVVGRLVAPGADLVDAALHRASGLLVGPGGLFSPHHHPRFRPSLFGLKGSL